MSWMRSSRTSAGSLNADTAPQPLHRAGCTLALLRFREEDILAPPTPIHGDENRRALPTQQRYRICLGAQAGRIMDETTHIKQADTQKIRTSHRIYAGAIALAFLAFLFTPGAFNGLRRESWHSVGIPSAEEVVWAILCLAGTFGLFIWFVSRRKIFGGLFTMLTLVVVAYMVLSDPFRMMAAFLLGVAIPSAFMCWKLYRNHHFGWKLAAWFCLSWPAVSVVGILLTGPYLFSVSVSKETAAPGEDISVTVKGLFGVPTGFVAVYLFPTEQAMPKQGSEAVYYIAEQDGRITTGYSTIHFPSPVHTIQITAGEQKWKCQGGDICQGADGPALGAFRVAVGVTNPLNSGSTILVLGPELRIGKTQAQQESANLKDEAEFLHAQLCQAVKERRDSKWGFVFEKIHCGGFQGAKPSIDPDTPVWDEKYDRVDERPPLFIENGNLCMSDTPVMYYTGRAKVCMPYGGDSLAELPDSKAVGIDLEWSGGQLRFEGHYAREIIQEEIWKHADKLFPEDNKAGKTLLQHTDSLLWDEMGSLYATTFAYQTPNPTWVRVTVDADFRVCLFAYKGQKNGREVPDFTKPEDWNRCTVLLEEPTP